MALPALAQTYLAVAAGGAIGASLRFAFGRWAAAAVGRDFPWGTLGVNVIGSFVMGLAAALMMERFPGAWGRFAPFLMTGVLGGFTTFSAFSLDALYLIEGGRWPRAAAYVAASVAGSILALVAGLAAGRAA
jgi:CrcB protein